jgi:hypothetical protein
LLELCPFGVAEAERIREEIDRRTLGRAPNPAFECAHAGDAHAGSLCEVFL